MAAECGTGGIPQPPPSVYAVHATPDFRFPESARQVAQQWWVDVLPNRLDIHLLEAYGRQLLRVDVARIPVLTRPRCEDLPLRNRQQVPDASPALGGSRERLGGHYTASRTQHSVSFAEEVIARDEVVGRFEGNDHVKTVWREGHCCRRAHAETDASLELSFRNSPVPNVDLLLVGVQAVNVRGAIPFHPEQILVGIAESDVQDMIVGRELRDVPNELRQGVPSRVERLWRLLPVAQVKVETVLREDVTRGGQVVEDGCAPLPATKYQREEPEELLELNPRTPRVTGTYVSDPSITPAAARVRPA